MISLQQNEVTLHDAQIGLFDQEAETQKYLTFGDIRRADTEDLGLGFPPDKWTLKFELSQDKKVESRKAYTLLQLLGDFGGFNDAIYFLLSLPMGFYSSSMYSKHVASLFKLRGKKSSRKRGHKQKQN